MQAWVLRLPFSDRPDLPILLHVSRKDDGHELDLDLLATEGDSAYRTKVRHRKIDRLRSTSYEGTEDDWANILRHTFVSKNDNRLSAAVQDNLEVTCNKLDKGTRSSLVILFRTRVQDITHKLGAIELPETSDQTDDVDLFGWTCQTVEKRDELESSLAKCTGQLSRAEETIKALELQIEELIKAKEEHENQLLSKFALLLNEKKLRIRDQQRIIAEQSNRSGGKSKSSSGKKRKTSEVAGSGSGDSESSQVLETMIDDELENQERTPSRTGTTDVDFSDHGDDAAPLKHVSQLSRSANSVTPPPRSLPFGSKVSVRKAGTDGDHIVEDEYTASEDDEL